MIFTREENSLWNRKMGKGRLDRIEKKKEKKSIREKDYRRLRSVNENEKKGQKKKNEKRRLN